MKTYHDCLACFVTQGLGLLRRCDATGEQITSCMRAVLRDLANLDMGLAPPLMARSIYRRVRDLTGRVDPYVNEKKLFNRLALDLLPQVRARIDREPDRLAACVRYSIAANIIDFGKKTDLTTHEAIRILDAAPDQGLDGAMLERFRQAAGQARRILFLFDNAGEIVFDRLLIEALPVGTVTGVVRGAPVINDATLEDARDAGLETLIEVISNGSDIPGTVVDECSRQFRTAYERADLVIAKGQGNFETLSNVTDKKIFFLLQVKCSILARDIKAPVGSYVISENVVTNAE